MRNSPWPILIIISALAVYHMFDFDHWSNESAIRSDGYGYYGYIEGTLVHSDPLNTLHGEISGRNAYRSWMHEGLPGKYLPKMTMGLAYAWVPGFFIADAFARAFGYDRNGWATPYQLAVAFTAILFLLLGCWALWQVLNQRFSSWIASITVFLIFYGTNLLHYSTSDSGMSHVYNFGLITFYVWLNDRWLKSNKTKTLLAMSLVLGWIVLIRPTNITIGLITPIMLFVQQGSLQRLFRPQLALAALLALIPIVPQLLFWKFTTGDWVHYSYENESFYWFTGNAIKGLFSYRNGWLLYTPIMLFALLGLFVSKRNDKALHVASAIVLGLHIYITFSWWCWYYGGSLSIRPMIDMYALCAFGLAGFLDYVVKKSWTITFFSFLLMGALVWDNYLQTHYFQTGAITDSTMTKRSFWAYFMQPKEPSSLSLIGDGYRDADTDRLRKGLPERTDFDTALIAEVARIDADERAGHFLLNPKNDFGQMLTVRAEDVVTEKKQLIQILFETYAEDYEKAQVFGVVAFDKGELHYQYRVANLLFTDPINDQWNRSSFFLRMPREVPMDAEMNVYLWFQGKGALHSKSIVVKIIEVTYSENQ